MKVLTVQRTEEVVTEGKTKRGFAVEGCPHLVDFECNDKVTKFNDPSQTEIMPGKGVLSNMTNAAVMMLLQEAGIPVAWKGISSENSFLSDRVTMIPLEVIIRRVADGSYLERMPHFKRPKGEQPHRFHRLVFELNLKTTRGGLRIGDTQFIADETYTPEQDDPWIVDPYATTWLLREPKKNAFESGNELGTISPLDFFAAVSGQGKSGAWVAEVIAHIENISRKVFLVLEGAWNILGYRLGDFKIELGINQCGTIFVADVIDSDSWRLRDRDNEDVSKQSSRDGEEISAVEKKYRIVQRLTSQFRIPNQALVVPWTGFPADEWNFDLLPEFRGMNVERLVCSGHKQTEQALNRLEEILWQYPDGGVILAKVGMSNGLGPILSTRTSWSVIGVLANAEEAPHNVGSRHWCPRDTPMMTVLSDKNALLAALNIFAQKNPIAYMERQSRIESLGSIY